MVLLGNQHLILVLLDVKETHRLVLQNKSHWYLTLMTTTNISQSCTISNKESCLCFLVHCVKQEHPEFKHLQNVTCLHAETWKKWNKSSLYLKQLCFNLWTKELP